MLARSVQPLWRSLDSKKQTSQTYINLWALYFVNLFLSLTSILLTVYSSSNLYNDPGYRIKKFTPPTITIIGDHHLTSNVQYYFLKIGSLILVFLNLHLKAKEEIFSRGWGGGRWKLIGLLKLTSRWILRWSYK